MTLTSLTVRNGQLILRDGTSIPISELRRAVLAYMNQYDADTDFMEVILNKLNQLTLESQEND